MLLHRVIEVISQQSWLRVDGKFSVFLFNWICQRGFEKKKKKPGIPGTAKVVLNLGRDMHHWTGMFLEVITWGLGMDSKGINMKGNNISDQNMDHVA